MAIQLQKNNGEAKMYEQVHERLKRFRKDCPANTGWAIRTKLTHADQTRVVVKAMILDPTKVVVATGHAEEVRTSSTINQTSAVENCETSAVGRALFMAGYGNGEICSAEELAAAINAQKGMNARPAPASGTADTSRGNVIDYPKDANSDPNKPSSANPGQSSGASQDPPASAKRSEPSSPAPSAGSNQLDTRVKAFINKMGWTVDKGVGLEIAKGKIRVNTKSGHWCLTGGTYRFSKYIGKSGAGFTYHQEWEGVEKVWIKKIEG